MPPLPIRSTLKQIPLGVWTLGFVSMLMDISSEMIHSLLPMFMIGVLGASALTVGLVEGLGEPIALIVKVFFGALSDYLGKRKRLALCGYALGALTKLLFAIAGGVGAVLTARLLDRVGKGIRGDPRDALVADIAPPHLLGAAFGLRQSIDTVGALLGPLIAVGGVRPNRRIFPQLTVRVFSTRQHTVHFTSVGRIPTAFAGRVSRRAHSEPPGKRRRRRRT